MNGAACLDKVCLTFACGCK